MVLCFLGLAGLLGLPRAQATLADYQTAVTNEWSLISYYPFDQSTAADVWSTNHGTLKGTATFTTGVNGAGTALLLDGFGWVNLGVVPDFAFEDDTGSIEAWFRAGPITYNANLFAHRSGATRYSVNLDADKQGIGMWNGSVYQPTVSIPNVTTNWHHLVVVFEYGEFKVYLDGALAGSQYRPLGRPVAILPTQLGSTSPTALDEGWVGALDEVAFYAEALPAETVLAHYQAFFAGSPPQIVKPPQGGVFLPGVALTLTVTATGPDLAYQWYQAGTALAGEMGPTLFFPSLTIADAGTYWVTVTNLTGAVTSAPVTIALESALPAALTRYQAVVRNEPSLVAYYTFDQRLPQDDHSWHDGQLSGSAGWGPGVGGGAAQSLALDGAGHLNLGWVPEFDFVSGTGTVEGWVRADWAGDDAGSDWPCMFANRDGTTRWSLHLKKDKSNLSFYNGFDSSLYAVPGGTAGNAWHHVAVVFEAGTATYYWDGVFIGTQARALNTNTVTVQLGSSAAATTAEGWVGMLDEVAFFAAALPAASIQARVNTYYQGQPPVVTAQPSGGTFLAGQPWQLSAGAHGGQLEYQWYKNDVAISGATNVFLQNTNSTPADSGEYHVVIVNANGSVPSDKAVIRVGNNIAQYQAAVRQESSLIAYYTFDAGDARDALNAHPGMLANVVAFGPGPGGVTNQSLRLQGAGHVDLGLVPEFDFADGTGTVECWMRADWTTNPGYDPCFLANRNGALGAGSVWSLHLTRFQYELGNWNSVRFYALAIPRVGGWHHCAVVFNAGIVTMYWDGRSLGSFIQSIDFNAEKTTQIGSAAPAITTEGWIGGLDEVAFYSAALDDATIGNHFFAMTGSAMIPAPVLRLERVGHQITLSWPPEAEGFTLEFSETVAGATWLPVPGVVNHQVTVDASSGARFYRLRQ